MSASALIAAERSGADCTSAPTAGVCSALGVWGVLCTKNSKRSTASPAPCRWRKITSPNFCETQVPKKFVGTRKRAMRASMRSNSIGSIQDLKLFFPIADCSSLHTSAHLSFVIMHLRLFLILPHENHRSGSSHADHPRLTFSENLPDPLQVQRHNYARLQRPNRESEPS